MSGYFLQCNLIIHLFISVGVNQANIWSKLLSGRSSQLLALQVMVPGKVKCKLLAEDHRATGLWRCAPPPSPLSMPARPAENS